MRPVALDVRGLLRRPVVVAPMAGGPSTPALVAAACGAGALGMVAGGYLSAEGLAGQLAEVRAATDEAFGVNVFVPGAPTEDPEALARYVAALRAEAAPLGAAPAEPRWDDDGFEDKLAVVLAARPALVSFTFGCPPPHVVADLHAAGSAVAVTVTSPDEARLATDADADVLGVQGMEAGAHRGTFVNAARPGQDWGLLALVGEVARVSDRPQIAAGGITDPGQVAAVLAAGAVAAQCGTAFLRCPESGTHPLHRAALADPRYTATVVTRAFSGRPARALLNRFVADHHDAPAAYPEVNNATRPLRAAAAERGDEGGMSLYAGQGFRGALDRPAGEVVERLAAAVTRRR